MSSMIVSPLDQPILLDDANKQMLIRVDEIVDAAIQRGDHRVIMESLSGLRAVGQVSGLAKAKMLYETQRRWKHFPVDAEYTFEDACMMEAGISSETIRKYVPIWKFVILNPALTEPQRDVLMTKPIGALDLLVAAAREGQITDEDWQEILHAPDKHTIREIVRRIRGEVGPSETAVVLMYHRDGRVTASRSNVIVPVGMMMTETHGLSEEQLEIQEIARERIVRASGMVVQQ